MCVVGAINDEQREQLCSQECANAIVGSPMRDCVLSQNPNVMNLDGELQNMVTDIRMYCDNAEPSMPAPSSAPAFEPLTPPFEAPNSAEVPASSIPIDPPESAPPTEQTEPSITAEPSIAAESSVAAEPSIAAVPSVAAESFIAVEPSMASEPSIAAELSLGAPFSVPVETPEPVESATVDLSGVSPEEDISEDDDGDVLEALDLL